MQKNKTSEFEAIKQALSKVNKCIYRATLAYDSIALLEKSAITGRAFESTEPKPRKKQKPPPSPFEKIIKSQHKNKLPVQIFQLPKQPFGVHQTYNEITDFMKTHIKQDAVPDEMMKNLEVLGRKFKLNEKVFSRRAKSSYSQRKKDEKAYQFKMESGYLVCPVVKDLTEIYDKDTELYQKLIEHHKKRKKSQQDFLDDSNKRKVQIDTVQRLFPARENVQNRKCQFYNSKYSVLFSDAEESTRPVTGLQKIDWNNIN